MNPRSHAVAVAFAAATASLAFAASTRKKLVTIGRPITVGSITLDAGEYEVGWSGAGRNVIISLSQHNRTIAIVPAVLQIVNTPHAASGAKLLVVIDWSKLEISAAHLLAS